MKHWLLHPFIVLILILLSSCSGNNLNPIVPVEEQDVSPAINGDTSRVLLGMFNLNINPETLEVTMVPMRNAEGHRSVLYLLIPPECDDCVDLTLNSLDWTNNILDMDMSLRNPHWADVYDVRAVVHATEAGFLLTNWDGWSLHWDIPGGEGINPYRSYAKSEPQRIFESGTTHGENFIISFPDPPGSWEISYAIDCSWPENCEEPYIIENYQQIGTLYNYIGSSCKFEIDVRDWQDNINQVFMQFPLINGEAYEMFTHKGGDTWECTLVNNQGLAAPGEYLIRFVANSDPHFEAMLNKFTVTVTEAIPDGITEITPPELNFSPNGVYVDQQDVFVAGSHTGLHHFQWDGSDNLDWTARADAMGTAHNLIVDNGYAFVTLHDNGLEIFDVDPVASMSSIGYVDTPGYAWGVAVQGQYAYVGDQMFGVQVIDISSISNPFIAHTAYGGSGLVLDVDIYNDYLIAANNTNGCEIFDISDPLATHLVATVPATSGGEVMVHVDGDFAYLSTGNGLQMIDITHPPNAYTLHDFPTPGNTFDVYAEDGYAYLQERDGMMYIYDVDPPAGAHLVTTIDHSGVGRRIYGSNGYIFHGEEYSSLKIIDCRIPIAPSVVCSKWTPGRVHSVRNVDDHAYCSLSLAGLQFVDTSNPYTPVVDKMVDMHETEFTMIDDGYAYVAGATSEFFSTVDIDPLASAGIAWSTATTRTPECVAISGNYAYVTMSYNGYFEIFDISDPAAPFSVHSLISSGSGNGVAIDGDYAYWCDGARLRIIDISDPLTAFQVGSISTPGISQKVVVRHGYAYVADGSGGLTIIDVDPPASAFVARWLDTPHTSANDIVLAGGYAYLADEEGILWIVDIDPIASASTYASIPIAGEGMGISRDDNILYVAARTGGLRIFELW